MKKDWDTQEQCDEFDLSLIDTSDSRTHLGATGALGYDELIGKRFNMDDLQLRNTLPHRYHRG